MSRLAVALTFIAAGGHAYAQAAASSAPPPQEPPAAPAPAKKLEAVSVTASRVSRTGFTAPTPTTSLGADDLQNANVTNVAVQLDKLPQFSPTSTPATTSHSSQNAGGNFLNLRGLGANRTLVLVDGHRFAPSTSQGLVDINVIPTAMIDHVDVVTGGASAAWGSDAVAGVVNIVLKDTIDGVQGEAGVGISQRGDGRDRHASLTGGFSFAGGRGHFNAGTEYDDANGIGSDRGWFKQHYATMANPAYRAGNGQPQNLILPDVGVSVATLGGLITSGPLKGLQFGPGGAVSPFAYGSNVGTQYMTGGDGLYPGDLISMQTPLERGNLYTHTTFDFTPDLQGYLDASYAFSRTRYAMSTSYDLGSITIRRDNAYLPASVAASMDQYGLSSFKMGRINRDIGYNITDNKNQTSRLAGGLRGAFGDGWNWDVYGEYGRNRYDAYIYNNRINANFTSAVDAVANGQGQVVCRSTLADPGNGCVPIDLFGDGSPSAAAIDYVTGTQRLRASMVERAAAANLRGEPFSDWAGPVSVATGIEYRKESVDQSVDALSAASAFAIGNPKPLSGSYNVREWFGETVVPLLADLPYAKSLDFNAAARLTEYSTSGLARTWKAGLSYDVDDQWRLRATRSRDIRAPNISELYSGYVLTFATVTDPARGTQTTVRSPTEGNTGLKPEVANTSTAGIIYSPGWAPGLQASLDWYDIRLGGAIATLTAQDIVNRCQGGNASLCAFVTRGDDGQLSQVVRSYVNLSSIRTRGFDAELTYLMPLSAWGAKGELQWRVLANYVSSFDTDDGITSLETAGTAGSGGPHWRATGSVTYTGGPLTVYLEGRYIGSGRYDTQQTYNRNHVASQFVTDLSVQYMLMEKGDKSLQLFGSINNLFDRDPPVDPYNFIFGSSTNAAVGYDIMGRYYSAGVRFTY